MNPSAMTRIDRSHNRVPGTTLVRPNDHRLAQWIVGIRGLKRLFHLFQIHLFVAKEIRATVIDVDKHLARLHH